MIGISTLNLALRYSILVIADLSFTPAYLTLVSRPFFEFDQSSTQSKSRSVGQHCVSSSPLFEFQTRLRQSTRGNRFLHHDMAGVWSRFAGIQPIVSTLPPELLDPASLSYLPRFEGVH